MMTVNRREQILTTLRGIAEQAEQPLDIAEAALLLADHHRPATDLAPYRRHLQVLADKTLTGRSIGEKATALRYWLAGEQGYIGDRDSYDDVANANLMRVIDRRCGMPVALAVLYLHCARAKGWQAVGLNFPGHFLIRLEDGAERVILDPFGGGVELDTAGLRGLIKTVGGPDAELSPDHYRPVSDLDLLFRLHNNVRVRLLKQGDLTEAAHATLALQALRPSDGRLSLEIGMLRARLGETDAAIRDLSEYLERSPAGPGHQEARRILAQLQDSNR